MTPHPKHGKVWRKAQRKQDARDRRRAQSTRRATVLREQAELDAATLRAAQAA